MATKAPTRSGISRKPARTGAAIARGCVMGRLHLPHLDGARPRPAMQGVHRPAAARTAAGPAARPVGLWRRDLARQGHALRPLGDRRHAGRFRLGLFSRDDPGLPAVADRRDDRGGQARRHSRQSPRLGHGRHRGLRRGACADAASPSATRRRIPSCRSPRMKRRSGSNASTTSAASRESSAIRSASAG